MVDPGLMDPLPIGTRLLHVGPQKTGTTTLQGAFHTQRDELERLGVHYAGRSRQARVAAAAVVNKRVMPGYPADSLSRWPQLVAEVRASTAQRVVVSAEMFANAKADTIPEIVEALGDQTHVVITVRPLAKIVASQWQQYVQSSLVVAYEPWLRAVLLGEGDLRAARVDNFWHRHQHDELAARWADVVGAERVTVVALDEADRGMNLRAFEALLDLPDGTLRAPDGTNRSLTAAEIEVIRQVNLLYRAEGWPHPVYEKTIRFGMDYYLREREPGPDEEPVRTPQWALDLIAERARGVVAGLRSSGVRVIGDADRLALDLTGPESAPPVDVVPADLAARAALGVVRATEIKPPAMDGRRALTPSEAVTAPRATGLDDASARDLATTLARRLAARVRRR